MITPGRADLTGLFAPPAGVESFRQGEVLTFDPADGSNTVRVGGAVLVDLPLLNIGDTINLAAGDAVVLLKYRSSWAILGRIMVPGGTGVQSAAVDFKTLSASNTNFAVPNSIYAVLCTGSVVVPIWANQCSAVLVGMLGAINHTLATDLLNSYVEIRPGLAGSVPFISVVPNTFSSITPSLAATFSVTPGETLNPILLGATATATWTVDANNRASLSGTFIFRKA